MLIAGRILAKYNSERPYRQEDLEEEGLAWKSNFSTKTLANIIERVVPRFVDAVQSLRYVTGSALPDNWPGASFKTDLFRREITNTIRAHPQWIPLLEEIAFENTLFGWAVVGWLDEDTWFPHAFRTDECLIPRGTKQSADLVQLIVLKEVILPHELWEKVKDRDAAEAAGWNLQNAIQAINQAAPPSIKGDYVNWPRLYEDYVRELSLGTSFEEGARVVNLYNVLAVEVDGKVSHYKMADVSGSFIPVFIREDRFNSMRDCLALFSYQRGNGTLHGSKGIGREIYELASIQDRIRNEIVDRLILSGKLIVQGDPANLRRYRMTVFGNTVLITSGVQIVEHKLDTGVEGFLKLDDYLSLLVDQITGATSPRVLKGERVTKAQVELFAQREEEIKDAKISRFLSQFAWMVQTMQRRLCSKDTDDPIAKELQARLLEHMTREELNKLAECPVASTVADFTPAQRQQIAVIAAENAGNPLYNARKLEEYKLTALINADFAKDVLLPENDPTEQAEQTRQQQLELLALLDGKPVPVSRRDNHAIHIETVLAIGTSSLEDIQDPGKASAVIKALVQHVQEHHDFYKQVVGKKDEILQQAEVFLKKAPQIIQQLDQAMAQAAAQQGAPLSAPLSAPPGALPGVLPGTPPGALPEGSAEAVPAPAGAPAGVPPELAGPGSGAAPLA